MFLWFSSKFSYFSELMLLYLRWPLQSKVPTPWLHTSISLHLCLRLCLLVHTIFPASLRLRESMLVFLFLAMESYLSLFLNPNLWVQISYLVLYWPPEFVVEALEFRRWDLLSHSPRFSLYCWRRSSLVWHRFHWLQEGMADQTNGGQQVHVCSLRLYRQYMLTVAYYPQHYH